MVHRMVDLKYSFIIEATTDPNFFGLYPPDLEGFTGIGHSIEDCLYKAKWGIEEHLELLKERGLSVPKSNPSPTILIQNKQRMEPAAR
jgi:predicted RNase H-like HicB family nuclease